jgi:hypothetical protein
MGITRFLLETAGATFVVFGLLHAIYTFLDIGRPRRLVPDDPAVSAAMARSQLRLARGRLTMWRAWVGFNFSHGLGVVLFGALCLFTGAVIATVAVPGWILLLLVAIGGSTSPSACATGSEPRSRPLPPPLPVCWWRG